MWLCSASASIATLASSLRIWSGWLGSPGSKSSSESITSEAKLVKSDESLSACEVKWRRPCLLSLELTCCRRVRVISAVQIGRSFAAARGSCGSDVARLALMFFCGVDSRWLLNYKRRASIGVGNSTISLLLDDSVRRRNGRCFLQLFGRNGELGGCLFSNFTCGHNLSFLALCGVEFCCCNARQIAPP